MRDFEQIKKKIVSFSIPKKKNKEPKKEGLFHEVGLEAVFKSLIKKKVRKRHEKS